MAYRVWVMLMFDAVVYRARGALVRGHYRARGHADV